MWFLIIIVLRTYENSDFHQILHLLTLFHGAIPDRVHFLHAATSLIWTTLNFEH